MKNLVTVLLGIAFLVSGLAYFQSHKANRQFKDQLHLLEEKVKTVETQVATLQNTLQTVTPAASQAPAQQQPPGTIQPSTTSNPALEAPTNSPPATTGQTRPNEATSPPPPPEVLSQEVSKHASLIKTRVERAWRVPEGTPATLSCLLRIELMPGGEVQNVSIGQSSGNASFDESAIAAVKRASPFPMPENTEVAARFRKFNFRFSPAS